jgi:hypothetical protein
MAIVNSESCVACVAIVDPAIEKLREEKSNVFESAASHHTVSFEKFLNPLLQRTFGFEARFP